MGEGTSTVMPNGSCTRVVRLLIDTLSCQKGLNAMGEKFLVCLFEEACLN